MVHKVFEKTELVLVSHNEEELCYLVEEADCQGAIDIGCTKSAAGFEWVKTDTAELSRIFTETLPISPSTSIWWGREASFKGLYSVPHSNRGEKGLYICGASRRWLTFPY